MALRRGVVCMAVCVACASAFHRNDERYRKRLTHVTAFYSNKVVIRPEELELLDPIVTKCEV